MKLSGNGNLRWQKRKKGAFKRTLIKEVQGDKKETEGALKKDLVKEVQCERVEMEGAL